MENKAEQKIESTEEPIKKKPYEKPAMEDHKPLEKSTSYVYYSYEYLW